MRRAHARQTFPQCSECTEEVKTAPQNPKEKSPIPDLTERPQVLGSRSELKCPWQWLCSVEPMYGGKRRRRGSGQGYDSTSMAEAGRVGQACAARQTFEGGGSSPPPPRSPPSDKTFLRINIKLCQTLAGHFCCTNPCVRPPTLGSTLAQWYRPHGGALAYHVL